MAVLSQGQAKARRRARLLVVEDEEVIALDLRERLGGLGYEVVGSASTAGEAVTRAAALRPDLVLMDIHLSGAGGAGTDGVGAAGEIHRRHDIPIVYLTADAGHATLERAKTTEPFGFILKPFDDRSLEASIEVAIHTHAETRRRLLGRARAHPAPPDGDLAGFEAFVGRSEALSRVLATCAHVAPTAATVLILGETGTGKELLAQALHRRSGRAGRFVAVNCGAIPEALVESELFGHVKGAFTGALGDAAGLFQRAHAGTLFLDEVSSLPPATQFSLLRALQEGRVRPVGGVEASVDVRIVAATSEPLDAAVREARFRPDLFYRLDVIRLTLPPLRDRREDVPLLFESFIRGYARQYGVAPPEVTSAFLDALRAHAWPGNVRQVRNLAERVVLTWAGARLDAPHLAGLLTTATSPTPVDPPLQPGVGLDDFLSPRIAELERRYLEELLRLHQGRMQVTAQAAGMSRRTLLRKLHLFGIDRRRFRRHGADSLEANERPAEGGRP